MLFYALLICFIPFPIPVCVFVCHAHTDEEEVEVWEVEMDDGIQTL